MDELDAALDKLSGYAPEFGSGLANHGPTAAEALLRLDRAEDIAGFVDRYRRRLEPGPPPGRPLDGDEWQGELGELPRWPDWVATFDAELANSPAEEVLTQWVPRLVPGVIAAGTHGLIRTAHAARALETAESPARRHELAQGLAYWAARYQELPGPPVLLGTGAIAETLAHLPQLPDEAPDEWRISDRVRHVEMIVTPFEQSVAALAPPPDVPGALDQVAVGGAVAYLANAGGGHEIALVHAVTAPLALQLLLGNLGSGDQATAFSYLWQAAAALHVAYARTRVPLDGPGRLPTPSLPERDELVDRAVASDDEHAIKLTEAALRAHHRTADPRLLAAAADLVERVA